MKKVIISFCFLAFISIGCNVDRKQASQEKDEFISSIPKIKTTTVKLSSFYTEINSNGKLEAVKKVDLKFENEGIIERILVNDGDQLKKGQLIAYQASNHIAFEEAKNKEILTKAQLNMEDILLGFGYSLKDSLSVPQETWNMAKSRSGISEANNQIIQTKKKYKASKLVAPFSGVIANLSAKEKNLSSTSDKICTLIDNKELLVNFYILEKEFGMVSRGDVIEISPIALPNQKFTGIIKYINPIINEHGLILIRASVENKDSLLIDGMNANVSVKKKIDGVISIPKRAVVDREERKVVFTYKNGRSQWNYVKLSHETRDSVVITEGLKIGDHLIIDGNIDLAHDAKVQLTE